LEKARFELKETESKLEKAKFELEKAEAKFEKAKQEKDEFSIQMAKSQITRIDKEITRINNELSSLNDLVVKLRSESIQDLESVKVDLTIENLSKMKIKFRENRCQPNKMVEANKLLTTEISKETKTKLEEAFGYLKKQDQSPDKNQRSPLCSIGASPGYGKSHFLDLVAQFKYGDDFAESCVPVTITFNSNTFFLENEKKFGWKSKNCYSNDIFIFLFK